MSAIALDASALMAESIDPWAIAKNPAMAIPETTVGSSLSRKLGYAFCAAGAYVGAAAPITSGRL